jgi:hypothetical protein
MKVNGKKISGANVEYVVIPRPDGDIVFKATAILDMKPFYDMCPQPKPPMVTYAGGEKKADTTDAAYLKSISEYGNLRYYFTIIWSLKDSNIEFEKVKYTDPNTWLLFEEELKEAGFNFQEIQRIIFGTMTANSLNESKLEEARTRFLVSLAAESAKLPSLTGEQLTTPSGEAANA